jgi:hypothetical protein
MADFTIAERRFCWSYSALKSYELCPRRHFHYKVARDFREPPSAALLTGQQMHAAIQARISDGVSLPLNLAVHEPFIDGLARLSGDRRLEAELALDDQGNPIPYRSRDAWFRVRLDYLVVRPNGIAAVLDFKTGRPDDDFTQIELQAAALFAHEPAIQSVRGSLWFVTAHDKPMGGRTYTREEMPRIWEAILPRVRAMADAWRGGDFPPTPNRLCRAHCVVASCEYHGKPLAA